MIITILTPKYYFQTSAKTIPMRPATLGVKYHLLGVKFHFKPITGMHPLTALVNQILL